MERTKPKLIETPSLFQELYDLDLKDEIESANFGFGDIPILPWAKAWRIIKTFDENAKFEIYQSPQGHPFFQTDFGVFVHVGLTIRGVTEKDWYPVEMGKQGVTARDIADAHQRGLVKCAGRHGLGLNLWEKKDKGSELGAAAPNHTASFVAAPAQSGVSFDADWVITFGKFKNKTFSEVPIEDLQSYVSWLETDATKKGEPLKGNALRLKQMTMARAQADPSEPPPISDDDYIGNPFR